VRRRCLAWTALFPLWMLAEVRALATGMATDAHVLPPARRSFTSPSGAFTLTVSSADQWATPQAQAELVTTVDGVRRSLWQQTLPAPLGPRRALVADTGAVVLLDEWRNSPSPHALLLIAPSGNILAHYSIDALITILGVTRKTVARHAQLGIWLSSEHQWSRDGTALQLRAGGQVLLLQLSSGQLVLLKD
jgi:hypothetical protein